MALQQYNSRDRSNNQKWHPSFGHCCLPKLKQNRCHNSSPHCTLSTYTQHLMPCTYRTAASPPRAAEKPNRKRPTPEPTRSRWENGVEAWSNSSTYRSQNTPPKLSRPKLFSYYTFVVVVVKRPLYHTQRREPVRLPAQAPRHTAPRLSAWMQPRLESPSQAPQTQLSSSVARRSA